MTTIRPRFNPSPCSDPLAGVDPLHTENGGLWTPIITCPADFPPDLFQVAVSQLIHHPEYNSTLILRSQVIEDTVARFPDLVPTLQNLRPVRNIHRRLLPRRPTRDSGLNQHCTLYAPHLPDVESLHPNVLVLTPVLPPGGCLPYYHPTVTHLAFRFVTSTSSTLATLRIEAIPLPGTSLDPGARLYRTCLALLETLHRYGWGALTQYKKRVIHDVLVPRETYQDFYLIMRERHKGLVNDWHEVTDPLKHVFEDIGIATFLMLLWKDSYGPETIPSGHTDAINAKAPTDEPWHRWPRPPGGFVDLGCGNGLLTHILISEGYSGYGIDLRARRSWVHYPTATQTCLVVRALDPIAASVDYYPGVRPSEENQDRDKSEDKDIKNESQMTLLPLDSFLIGNHADELTPWVPLLATRVRASGYLSIPCCAWGLDARFDRARDVPLCAVDTEALNLGGGNESGDGVGSSYALYRVWLASLSVHCGWAVEVEVLRIPSTRNWAIVGRKRVYPSEVASRNVEELIEGVRKRGQFQTRYPEGKAGDH
ncbi:hypothetical protein B0F90DRAFT_1624965 [Multifurca ochricompacta]|uniref:tRNA (uracil-O(2)-)-methyltransferase n=1 Tax=Multifurca ochricompacta TaxID=376703 RepID=A0AAD4M9F5_9AGAM|nr:hypothetical protein B0F90DRAFT_1624965 [Multifurca ochricompacta]